MTFFSQLNDLVVSPLKYTQLRQPRNINMLDSHDVSYRFHSIRRAISCFLENHGRGNSIKHNNLVPLLKVRLSLERNTEKAQSADKHTRILAYKRHVYPMNPVVVV